MPVKKQQLEPNMEQWTDTIESTDAEAEVPILWPPDGTNWLIEKAREFQKNVYFCFNDYTKAFDCVDHNK